MRNFFLDLQWSGNALGIWICGCRLFFKGVVSYKSVSYRTPPPPRFFSLVLKKFISDIHTSIVFLNKTFHLISCRTIDDTWYWGLISEKHSLLLFLHVNFFWYERALLSYSNWDKKETWVPFNPVLFITTYVGAIMMLVESNTFDT